MMYWQAEGQTYGPTGQHSKYVVFLSKAVMDFFLNTQNNQCATLIQLYVQYNAKL